MQKENCAKNKAKVFIVITYIAIWESLSLALSSAND